MFSLGFVTDLAEDSSINFNEAATIVLYVMFCEMSCSKGYISIENAVICKIVFIF